VKYEASAPIASQPFGQPKPRLLDRLLTPAPRVPEIDCKISQPNSAGLEAPRARQTDRNQPLTTRTEIQGQGNRLQPLQRLRYWTGLSNCSRKGYSNPTKRPTQAQEAVEVDGADHGWSRYEKGTSRSSRGRSPLVVYRTPGLGRRPSRCVHRDYMGDQGALAGCRTTCATCLVAAHVDRHDADRRVGLLSLADA